MTVDRNGRIVNIDQIGRKKIKIPVEQEPEGAKGRRNTMKETERAEIEVSDSKSYKLIRTAETLQSAIDNYVNIVTGISMSTPELKKAAQNFIIEFCTTLFKF